MPSCSSQQQLQKEGLGQRTYTNTKLNSINEDEMTPSTAIDDDGGSGDGWAELVIIPLVADTMLALRSSGDRSTFQALPISDENDPSASASASLSQAPIMMTPRRVACQVVQANDNYKKSLQP